MVFLILVCLLVGYGFGCFSTGYVIGKCNGIDIRNEGSGNAGTTNALRTLGPKAGLYTFIGDVLKAVIPIVVVRYFVEDVDKGILLAMFAGLGVALGHNYPFWLRFKGGKGIAVTAAVIISLADWRVTACGLLLFIAIVLITKYVSLGSLVVAWYLPIDIIIFHRESPMFLRLFILSLFFTVLAYIKHWPNIKRLLNGTENKFTSKESKNK